MAEERVQKILARAGFGSRRDCEEYLRAGRVTVNGIKAELGSKADAARDKILLDQKPIQVRVEPIYIALNKPRQVLSAINQDDDRKDVLDLVPNMGHLFPVGRLDYDSEGLLLLTNDGDFANKLAHPRYEHEKEYLVQIGSRPDDSQLETWRRGVVLEDGYRTAPAKVEVIESQPKSATLRIVLHEGRKRQIRESGERIGLPVQRIKRIRIGSILLGDLKPGEWRNLNRQEIASMKNPRLTSTTEEAKRPLRRVYSNQPDQTGRQKTFRTNRSNEGGGQGKFRRTSTRQENPADDWEKPVSLVDSWEREVTEQKPDRSEKPGRTYTRKTGSSHPRSESSRQPGGPRRSTGRPFRGSDTRTGDDRQNQPEGYSRPDGEHRRPGRPSGGSYSRKSGDTTSQADNSSKPEGGYRKSGQPEGSGYKRSDRPDTSAGAAEEKRPYRKPSGAKPEHTPNRKSPARRIFGNKNRSK